MARWEITREGNKTTIKRNHPFWDAVVVLFGLALVVSSVERAPWLIVPTVLILGGAVWLRVKASQKAKHGSPKQAAVPEQPRGVPTPPRPASPTLGVADELTKLADLHSKGVLSDTEFATQKAKLLGRS